MAHRDIKPENVYRHEDAWVVGDLGLIQIPDAESLTAGAGMLGPKYFLAPEMMVDPASAAGAPADVYSLAKTMWVLATGQRFPPPGQHLLSELAMRVSTYTPHPYGYQLDALLERATAFDPAARPAAREFRDELTAWLRNQEPQTEMPVDLSAVTSRLITLLGPIERAARDEEDNKGLRLRATHELLARLSEYLERAAEMLLQSGLPVDGPARINLEVESYGFMSGAAGISTDAGLMDRLLGHIHLTGDDHRHDNGLVVGAISGRSVENPLFVTSVGIRSIFDGEPAYIFAGHAVAWRANYSPGKVDNFPSGRMLWGETANGLLRSAQLRAACDDLGEAMLAALPTALDQYVAYLQEWRITQSEPPSNNFAEG
jgi:hypothetical protein